MPNDNIHRFPQVSPGRVEETITPTQRGRVKYQATYWPAKLYDPTCTQTLQPGAAVTVIGRKGITLLVIPA